MKKIKLSNLKLNDRNPRTINTEAFERLCESIKRDPEFMVLRPIICDLKCVILGGNQRYRACLHLGMTEVPENWVRLAGDLNEEQRRRFILVDNAPEGMSGEWDWDILSADWELPELKDLGFDELAKELQGNGDEQDAEPQIDKAEELNKKWKVKTGDLWDIGGHMLLCGDSTKKEDVARLLGGHKPVLMVTDPPYGVEYEGGQVNARKREKLSGDESADLYSPSLALAAKHMPVGAWYVWHADRCAAPVYAAISGAGFDIRALLIWNKMKPHYGAPSAHYCQKHEPCLYAVKGNAAFCGPSNECTVWDINQPSRNEHHPTQKPLECMARPIRNHDVAEVYDPFLGSGTTMVAAHNLERRCFGIEISPAYCAVILDRMTSAFEGIEIKRLK